MLQAGKMAEIADELLKYNLDITALQELRWKGYGRIKKPRYILLYSGAEKQGEQGVGFIIKRSMEHSIIGFEPINSRLCKIRIKGRFYNTTVVNVYAPTENAQEEQKEQFYEDLSRCDQIPKHDALLILGDFNAKIGKELANQSVGGQHTIHEETSENGLILCQFAEANDLLISSTCFEHKDIYKGTWKDPAGRTINQIDHVLINKRRATIVEDVKTMRGANCDSDHFLIRILIKHRISRAYQKNQTFKLRWDIQKLDNKETKKKEYQEHITEKLKNIEKKQEVNEEWTNIKNVILEAAKIEIGELRKRRNQDWYDEECQMAMREKHEARKRCLNKETRKNKEEYRGKRKIATKLCRRKKREMWNKKIEEIRDINIKKNARKFYREVKEMSKEYQQRNVIYKDEKGKY